ncbi:DGQHR domain-containing protein [Paenibacillus sp. CF384]|uniref:DGQHR domain-containing protein n=1 Tax=Paenibacillus sp. CF384 TaxID=1884382 RepID=UPI00089C5A73|nr:DGQHR domain-containing protein [Paenibacillus sp. CF384]SDX55040.1 DNA sulfur modification protein DndB [Paenibacillus sp. CF384]
MNVIERLVSKKELDVVRKKRARVYNYSNFEPELQAKRENEGWNLDKILKKSVRMKKAKPQDEQFEDEVWCLFASLGFQYMNRDRYLQFPYGSNGAATKQVDVFAVDDETILFIECKCAQSGKKGDFKKDIEAISGFRNGLFAEARKLFPGKRQKYIFATKNYELSDNDRARMKELEIQHFDEYTIMYFSELTRHLGRSARYQLLGSLFQGKKINAMENKVPAIEGSMGGHKYYAFSIEPEKLLKIAYVLHRNEANNELMPTYQRLIKKSRLDAIQKFVNGGGFFPNSLIISIDSNNLKFDIASPQVESSVSRIGILHLPQLYRSAYIIDGQHRLYGYADSKYSNTNSIPVVAFLNLNKEKQVELFMEINENQKSVPKNLKNSLNADLLWDSEDWNKQRQALRLRIAEKLGEVQSSPLFSRVKIGENETISNNYISTDTIEIALKSTKFLSKYSKMNSIIENGTFDKGNNEATLKVLYPFISHCLSYIKEGAEEEWENDEPKRIILTNNNSINALIRIMNDIVNHLIKLNKINPNIVTPYDAAAEVEYYLSPLIHYFNLISEDQRKELRSYYGSGAPIKVWRTYQKVIADSRTDFQPEGLTQWIKDNTKQFNFESYQMIQDLENAIKNNFSEKLKGKYGDNWVIAGLPAKVFNQANTIMGKRNYESSKNNFGKTLNVWDCVTIANCKDIATFGPNWTELFESICTRPEETKLQGGKNAKTAWINRLSTLSNNNGNSNYSVSEDDYLFLKSLYIWLVGTKVYN